MRTLAVFAKHCARRARRIWGYMEERQVLNTKLIANQNATRHGNVQEGTAQLMSATLMDGGLASARNKQALEARRTGLAIKMQTVQKGLEGIEHELEELETYSQKYSATFGFMCMLTELMRTGVSGEKESVLLLLLLLSPKKTCSLFFVLCSLYWCSL